MASSGYSWQTLTTIGELRLLLASTGYYWRAFQVCLRDLASIPEVALTTTPQYIPTALLTDFDDNTCNTDPALQSVKISWPTSYPFLWTRFKVKDAECVPGMWGLDCEKACPQVCNITCHQDTGLCPTRLGYLDASLRSGVKFVCSVFASGDTCEPGWFGIWCTLMCRCDPSGSCDSTGQCSNGCLRGWFGQKCQYQTPFGNTQWLIDGNDATCNSNPYLQSLEIIWSSNIPFRWLRVKVKSTASKQVFGISLINPNRQTLTSKGLVYVIDDTTLDYRFDVNDRVNRILVTGTGLQSLCSLYVSGGRNVALRQKATQSSTYETYGAQLAVDGNTDGYFNTGKTCTHTGPMVENLNWTLTFDSPKVIQTIFIYNRVDCCSERLQNFRIEMYDSRNVMVLSYEDATVLKSRYAIYFIMKDIVSKVSIFPTNRRSEDPYMILTLCEVRLFG
ncbi:hypothetical protein Btru_059368, partial [Bulinus truncatus]